MSLCIACEKQSQGCSEPEPSDVGSGTPLLHYACDKGLVLWETHLPFNQTRGFLILR